MADNVTVRLDRAAIRALGTDPNMRRYILDAGRGFAQRAAALAPKATGAGAASIRGDISAQDPSAADVSWDHDRFYMIFHEDGTRHIAGRHFMRTTLESYIHT